MAAVLYAMGAGDIRLVGNYVVVVIVIVRIVLLVQHQIL